MSQGPGVNAFQRSISPSLLPSEFGGKLSLDDPDRRDLLNDPSLTEDYADLVKMKPILPMEHEGESNSGSVVVTEESSARAAYATMPLEPEEQRDHDYDYSDSEFEESLEKRLQDMDTGLPGDRRTLSNDGSGSGSGSAYDGVSTALSEDEDDLHLEDEDEDDAGMDYVEAYDDDDELQPLPPPRELDPDKLYALYAFSGPDPSHCQLKQDEPCTLLNDQDAYWWLVRRYDDSKIGFAPAEILETYPERLARLNCWKNENMSATKCDQDSDEGQESNCHEEEQEEDEDEEGDETAQGDEERPKEQRLGLKEYGKSNKSVSFNDVISYADRYIEEHSDDGEDNEPTQYDEFSESKLRVGRIMEDDEMSEATSDASFNTASMVPLNVEKRRQVPRDQTQQGYKRASGEQIVKGIDENRNSFIETQEEAQRDGSAEDGQDGLHKIFEAPVLPFGRKATSQMENSNSDYSISTIGEFSPSSSEWTSDSPQQHITDHHSPRTIPPSRAIQDLTKIVGKDDESAATLQGGGGGQDHKVESIEPRHTKETPASSSSSSEEIFMEAERVGSSTSVNSTSSTPRQLYHSTSYVSSTTTGKHHPLIDQLYNPIFHRMDDLLKEIEAADK